MKLRRMCGPVVAWSHGNRNLFRNFEVELRFQFVDFSLILCLAAQTLFACRMLMQCGFLSCLMLPKPLD